MLIWPATITGEHPHDLDIINELNHYIGMQKIIPESIPELHYIKPIIIAFGILSLLAAFRPRILITALLLGGLSGAGAAGMIDFWFWEYDYGHNLNPMAAIKVPGMSYQPPLIGEAKLLNFLSCSWPALGGYLLFAAGGLMALSLAVLVARKLGWPASLRSKRKLAGSVLSAMALMSLGLSGCGQNGPLPIAWGEDVCHFCKMTLVQKGFAAQRINAKGKAYKFDSIECLLEDLKMRPATANELIFVSDWSRPEAGFLEARSAVFLKAASIASPMGSGLAGFAAKDSALAFRNRMGGEIMEWERLPSL
jgi:copper chaperone NosL